MMKVLSQKSENSSKKKKKDQQHNVKMTHLAPSIDIFNSSHQNDGLSLLIFFIFFIAVRQVRLAHASMFFSKLIGFTGQLK